MDGWKLQGIFLHCGLNGKTWASCTSYLMTSLVRHANGCVLSPFVLAVLLHQHSFAWDRRDHELVVRAGMDGMKVLQR